MRIIVIGSPELSTALAGHLHLDHIREIAEIKHDGFVLDGSSLDIAEARALDAVLRLRATEIDAVLLVEGGDPNVIAHYMGRVLEPALSAEPFEAVLDGLREVLLAV